MLKKKIPTFALTLALLTSLTAAQSRPAHAIVGCITANPALTIAGGLTMSGGAFAAIPIVGMISLPFVKKDDHSFILGAIAGLATFVTGLVLLDEGDQIVPAFAPLAPATENAKNAALGSPAQLEVYNHELDELNAVRESVQAEANALVARGEKFDLKRSASLWKRHERELSVETRTVAARVLQVAFKL